MSETIPHTALKDKQRALRADFPETMGLRVQVGDSAAILGFLMPVFVDIMMNNPDGDWGQPFYPVVD